MDIPEKGIVSKLSFTSTSDLSSLLAVFNTRHPIIRAQWIVMCLRLSRKSEFSTFM